MAFNVSGLSEFKQKATEFLLTGIVYSDDFARFDIQTGIQHKQYLNYLDASPVLMAGGCGVAASGSTVFSEKEITVTPIQSQQVYCLADLNQKDIVGENGTGKGDITSDLKVPLAQDTIAKIKQGIDGLVWNGATGSGDLFDGIVTEAAADSDVVDVTAATNTVSTIKANVEAMIAAVPADMWSRGKLTIHVSQANFNLYKQALINANLYHAAPTTDMSVTDVFGWEGSVEIKAEPGMAGVTNMLLTWDKNIVIGTDELAEVAEAKFVYDELTNNVHFISRFKMGVTYKFGTEVVLFTV